ncbi:hypothetical protein O6H91_11G002300 [Diphasiastrum complanatum]|uniref:Uncharacterized protein n=1 Tax=Diphasiastrum complanatum TaxID=34168 RepID=A0ACC2C5N7_DIPCM|nr:hypothetical protein O6H91_11G002300 [Diphasiastrum complanatum]
MQPIIICWYAVPFLEARGQQIGTAMELASDKCGELLTMSMRIGFVLVLINLHCSSLQQIRFSSLFYFDFYRTGRLQVLLLRSFRMADSACYYGMTSTNLQRTFQKRPTEDP